MSKRASLLATTQESVDFGLLVLRLVSGLTLLIRHGLEKGFGFQAMAHGAHAFPDPIHIGPVATLTIALISDFLCSILVVLGLGTRIASLYIFANLFVALALAHHFTFTGPLAEHSELMVVYLGAFATLAIAGAGRYSIDGMAMRRSGK